MSLSLLAIPILSNKPDILAIYSICISFGLFFRYSDFGFISSSVKYASEYVVSKQFNLQLRFLGNGFSLSFLISLILSILLFITSFNPEIIISDLEFNPEYSYIASILLKTLSISSLIQVFSNYIISVFSVNLKKYYSDLISIFTGALALLSFLLINKSNDNWILTYFIVTKILDFIGLLMLIILSNKIFKIKIFEFISNFRIHKNQFKSSIKLSVTSLITSFSAFVFYELDNLFLARYLDLTSISIFAIAALGPTILKTIFSLLYSPFTQIFNYLKNDISLYKKYFNKVVVFFFPITFIGLLVIMLFSEQIIYSYVSSDFKESVLPFIYLTLSWCFSFIVHPTGIYLFSKEFNKRIIICALLPMIIFWASNIYIINFNGNITVEQFCLNKLASKLIIIPIYIYYLFKDKFIGFVLIGKLFKSLFFGSLVLGIFYLPFSQILFNEKSKLGLIINVFLIGSLILLIKILDLKVNKNQINFRKVFSSK